MPGQQPAFSILITAEHASRRIPARWAGLFDGHEAVLDSHRAWDPGTRELAQALSAELNAPLLLGQVSRLLVDLNRSATHRQLFSEFSRGLTNGQRAELMESYWQPHWTAYDAHIVAAPLQLVHLACHSFTPVFNGVDRRADIGLLYDPSRLAEKQLARSIATEIGRVRPDWKIRMNDPYRGTANGLGQQHRRRYSGARLVTVELEVNCRWVASAQWPALKALIAASCQRALGR